MIIHYVPTIQSVNLQSKARVLFYNFLISLSVPIVNLIQQRN